MKEKYTGSAGIEGDAGISESNEAWPELSVSTYDT